MSFSALRKHALITAAGVGLAVVVPLGGALAPAANASSTPSTSVAAGAVPLTAAQSAAAKQKAAAAKVAAQKAAAKKRAAARAAAKKRAARLKVIRQIKRGKLLVRVASRYRGAPYVYGAAGPRAFDCSGFTGFVARKALHIHLPRTANGQGHSRKVKHVSKAHRRVGDLIFFGSGFYTHVAIYAGHGLMWDAPHSGSHVHKHRIYTSHVKYGRIV